MYHSTRSFSERPCTQKNSVNFSLSFEQRYKDSCFLSFISGVFSIAQKEIDLTVIDLFN